MIAQLNRPGQRRMPESYEVPAGTRVIALKPWQSPITTQKPHTSTTIRPMRFTADDLVERPRNEMGVWVFRFAHRDGFDRMLVPANSVITHIA